MRMLISVLALAGVALASPALGAAADNEQTYPVSGCSVAGQYVPLEGWTASSTPAMATVAVDQCATVGKFGFDLDPASGAVGRWAFSAPAGTVIHAVGFYDLVGSGDPKYKLLIHADDLVYDLPYWFTNGVPWTSGELAGFNGKDARSTVLEFRCPAPCDATEPASVRATRIETFLRDVSAPTIELDSAARSLRFADVGGGVESADLEVDGVWRHVELGDSSCRRPFVHLVPCPTTGEVALADLHIDPGYRSIFATFTDVAGNRTYSGPYVVDVPAPPPAPISEPSPALVPRPLGTLTLDGASRLRTGYRTTMVTGTVRDVEGFPLANAPVDVATRAEGAAWKVLPSVETNARGRFSATIPRGTSREVRVAYGESAQTVRVVVVAPVDLSTNRKVTRNGRTITFRGRIPEVGNAPVRVALQAWARGKWIPFKTVKLRQGKFVARYRFTGTFATTRYRFRAAVDDQPDLPFAAGTSPAISVLVRPKGGR
jgi:hypothetical protein